jgi:hypothetical protein
VKTEMNTTKAGVQPTVTGEYSKKYHKAKHQQEYDKHQLNLLTDISHH